jgi:hypothetical protein
VKPPLLDKRTRAVVLEQALQLAGIDPPGTWVGYTPDWSGAPEDPGYRLMELFSRLAEVLIERLNGVPEKNFLAFLDLAGVERFPGAPAEVPVTFLVSKRAPVGGLVPAKTQVATTQTKTANAHVFETRRDFYATRAELIRMYALDPATDRFAAVPVLAPPPTAPALAAAVAIPVLTPASPALGDVQHVLYIANETLFARKDVVNIDLTLQFLAAETPPSVRWQKYNKTAKGWENVTSVLTTAIPGRATYRFFSFSAVDKATVDGVEDHWLAALFEGDFATLPSPPFVTRISGVVDPPSAPPAVLDAAFYNAAKLDATKPFLPFGRRPMYGDALYLGSRVGFAPDNASVTLTFTIRPYTNAALIEQFDDLEDPLTILTLAQWQYRNAAGAWVDLGSGSFAHDFIFAAGTGAITRTPATSNGAIGTLIGPATTSEDPMPIAVTFTVPSDVALHKVNGLESRWFRMLLKSDNPYGFEGVVVGEAETTQFIGPLLIPPRVDQVTIGYTPLGTEEWITRAKTLNNFEWRDHPFATGFIPYVSLAAHQADGQTAFGTAPGFYCAFDRLFEPAAFISLFVDLAGPVSSLTSPLESGNPGIAWEYWSGEGWRPLDVIDETLDLTTSGTVGFVAPRDAAPAVLFAQTDPAAEPDAVPRWWIRARLASGSFDHPPRVRDVYVNSVMAENRVTTATLLLGSSNAEPEQSFDVIRAPVLGGELWVREPELPTADDLDGLDVMPIAAGDGEAWVRWIRVPNFELSGPRSRHYLLDAVIGRVTFGGLGQGLIPPIGRDNLVIRDCVTGGGEAANRETGILAVKELKTSLPFIDKVFNVQPATAGASAWSLRQLLEFGPQSLKTHGRSVTTEDYSWMVLQRFSEVARARSHAVRAPAPDGTLVFKAGAVTVLVVPWSADPRPQPSPGLIRKVREYLAQTSLGNIVADIYVKGPGYVPVDIEAVLVATRPEMASVVLRRAQGAIERFLHPLTGGEDGSGYGFGRAVYLSEVQATLERLEDVDHVVSARFVTRPTETAFTITGDRLASSGTHQITVLGMGAGT